MVIKLILFDYHLTSLQLRLAKRVTRHDPFRKNMLFLPLGYTEQEVALSSKGYLLKTCIKTRYILKTRKGNIRRTKISEIQKKKKKKKKGGCLNQA